jgi:hypothetical protein
MTAHQRRVPTPDGAAERQSGNDQLRCRRSEERCGDGESMSQGLRGMPLLLTPLLLLPAGVLLV